MNRPHATVSMESIAEAGRKRNTKGLQATAVLKKGLWPAVITASRSRGTAKETSPPRNPGMGMYFVPNQAGSYPSVPFLNNRDPTEQASGAAVQAGPGSLPARAG